MIIIVHGILLFSILFGLWLICEVVKFYQGEKIKSYWGRYLAIKEAERLEEELRQQRILKQLERNRVIEVDVEEVEADELQKWESVRYNKAKTKHVILEITNLPTKQ